MLASVPVNGAYSLGDSAFHSSLLPLLLPLTQVMMHGGHFDAYKTSRTTHFLCNHFPNTKLSGSHLNSLKHRAVLI